MVVGALSAQCNYIKLLYLRTAQWQTSAVCELMRYGAEQINILCQAIIFQPSYKSLLFGFQQIRSMIIRIFQYLLNCSWGNSNCIYCVHGNTKTLMWNVLTGERRSWTRMNFLSGMRWQNFSSVTLVLDMGCTAAWSYHDNVTRANTDGVSCGNLEV